MHICIFYKRIILLHRKFAFGLIFSIGQLFYLNGICIQIYEGHYLYFGNWQHCCHVSPSDGSIVKFDIFDDIRTQNILSHGRYLFILYSVESFVSAKNGTESWTFSRDDFLRFSTWVITTRLHRST